jgi:hypothetical protein
METIVVQLNSDKALKFLKELEDLNIIKLLSKTISSKEKMSEKYAGTFPEELADEFQNYVSDSRVEWQKRSI